MGPYTIDSIADNILYVTEGKTTPPFKTTKFIDETSANKDSDFKETIKK